MKRLPLILLVLCIGAHASKAQDLAPVKHLIDTHIHLYDTTRDIEISWPPKDDRVLYKPHLPAEYSRVAKASGVTGVVIVEASNHLADNWWVLDLVAGDDFYLGLVGNIDVYREDFEDQLVTLKRDRRFVGVRPRGTKPIDFSDEIVLKNLALLAEHDLAMDYLTNSGGIPGIETIDGVARKIPRLRIVVNHCLGYNFDGKRPQREWIAAVETWHRTKTSTARYPACTSDPSHSLPHSRSITTNPFSMCSGRTLGRSA
ncbi:MAG: amidohydrolase [Phycisphaera sp. RhM]|nr:amidohydrolase [Phycisphaera sp. RhM]